MFLRLLVLQVVPVTVGYHVPLTVLCVEPKVSPPCPSQKSNEVLDVIKEKTERICFNND